MVPAVPVKGQSAPAPYRGTCRAVLNPHTGWGDCQSQGQTVHHRLLSGVIQPRGGEGIKALSWPIREKDSARKAQKDVLALRTEAAMSPSPVGGCGVPAPTRGQLGSARC